MTALPSSLTRFALTDITVEGILERRARFPEPALSVMDFVDRWVVTSQPEYLWPRTDAQWA